MKTIRGGIIGCGDVTEVKAVPRHTQGHMRLNVSEATPLYGPKKSANLSVNAALLDEAKALGINLSRAFEQHLSELVRREKEDAWHSEHREGIDAYNRLVEKHGVFGDKWRKF